MTRRDMLTASIAASAASANAQAAPKSAYYELRYYRLRTDRADQSKRTTAFLTGAYLPAARRAGAGPIGLFGSVIAPASPFLLCLTSFPSLAAIEDVREKLAGDAAYQKGLAEYNASPEPGFMRMESWLLRAFDFFPAIATPAPDAARAPRVFELRTYESLNETTLREKIKMFGAGGEIGIFRRCGLDPILFGEAIAGANQPHVTYMVAFDNLAAREKVWAVFQADAGWQKLRSTPEYAAPGLVINISNSILSAVDGSEIT
ncbi:MAG: NIPSNAP family protein [Bryobacteraceae bacterium]|jgi:hypothetical protein